MQEPIQTLTSQHARIRAMLAAFETQLDRIENAKDPDYEILNGSIAYCQEYLDRWHHPFEDALLELLAIHAPAEAKLCTELEGQHSDLAIATGAMVHIFEAVELDAPFLRDDLVSRGQSLLRDYRCHLEWEEATFFPAIAEHLLPHHCKGIAGLFPDSADPLFQNPVDQRYRKLLIALISR